MKITRIETTTCPDISGALLLCRIHTEDGLIGHGESYYIPQAVAAIIHDWMARRLLGASALDVESHWRFLYERASAFGARGAELRALSALDLALWDIKAQACGMPVWQLLGGRTQQSVRIYNSSGGTAYGGKRPATDKGGWPGHGRIGEREPLNDYWMAVHEPAAYARELVEEGITGVKMWTLDFAAHQHDGPRHVSHADIDKGLRPFFAMREAVGDQLELMLDGHGFFELPMALRIAEALRPARPLWLEDVVRVDCVDTVAQFRQRCGLPLAVSEMLIGAEDYRLVLEKRATDYVMIDPTWVGGISQTLRLTDLAQHYNLPVVMHDCTGPLTLLAGVHVGIARANVAWQETLRAHLRLRYPRLVTQAPTIEAGRALPPMDPGLGAAWLDEHFQQRPELRQSTLT